MSHVTHLGVARFLIVWVILAGTALFLHGRSSFERVPSHRGLHTFPREIDGWTGTDVPMDGKTLQVLGPGDFLSRTYRSASETLPIELFVAYYPSQRTGDTIHSPQNCMPGAGWTVLSMDHVELSNDEHQKAVTSNRLVFAKGMDRVLVLYWYQAHGRTTPSEYWAKYYLVRDSMVMQRTDGAIVRIAAPIPSPSEEGRTQALAIRFAKILVNTLDSYVPR